MGTTNQKTAAAKSAALNLARLKVACAALIAQSEETVASVRKTGHWAGEIGYYADRIAEMVRK